uniref:Uncharacterized protein n=1 Tax=Anguilla anguilla TaxID=7936 RepID=A0A0E9TRB8_ANGAN
MSLKCREHPEVATNFSCTSCACDKDKLKKLEQ